MKKDEVMPELLKACPSFALDWQRLQDTGNSELLYIVLGDFARHLLLVKKEGREEVLRAAGAFIERMHREGDDYVREAATVGALEGIQNVWGNSGEDPEAFSSFLGSESKRWWSSLHRFWEGKIPHVGADLKEATQSPEPMPLKRHGPS